jgi:tetratricopeptide (TPR) repeat protein
VPIVTRAYMELGKRAKMLLKRSNHPSKILSILLLIMLVQFTGITTIGYADENQSELDKLEDEVWLAEDHELPFIEQRVTRQIQLHPRSAQAHYLMALVLKRSFAADPGELLYLRQASQTAQQAVDLDPQSDYGYVAMADVLDLMGNGDKGLALLSDAETSGIPPSWRFYFSRARLIADRSNTKKVLGLLETALAFNKTHPKIILPYVIAILKSESQGKKLISSLQDWNNRYPSSLLALTLAIEYEENSEHIKAHKIYTQIIKESPKDREANINDAVILYKHLGRSKTAIKQLQLVLNNTSENSPNFVKSIIHAHIGSAYVHLKQFKNAEKSFARAIAMDNQNLNLIDFTAATYRENKATKHLASLLKNISRSQPGTGVVYAILAETLSEKLGHHDEAIEAFSNAIVLDPNRSDYYNGMGLAYYRKKDFNSALNTFSEASKIDPNDAVARYNEACIHSLLNNKSKAINKLKDALALDPRLTENVKSDADLDNIRGEAAFQEMLPSTAISH